MNKNVDFFKVKSCNLEYIFKKWFFCCVKFVSDVLLNFGILQIYFPIFDKEMKRLF